MQLQPIQIQREIHYVDCLSPLLFSIAFIPLTHELNWADCGYPVHGTEMKISHLYMDGLQLLRRSLGLLEN